MCRSVFLKHLTLQVDIVTFSEIKKNAYQEIFDGIFTNKDVWDQFIYQHIQ